MLIIALTGGIGSGKSTVAHYFAALDVPVIDADQIARELVTPGSPALQEIAATFGPAIMQPNGELDRTMLRQRVFNDPTQRRRLEAILHPLVYAEMRRRIKTLHAPYCLLVIPLLLESGETALADRILVVDSPVNLQRQRVQARDALDDATLDAILRAQVSREQRLRAANDIIVNDGELPALRQQVEDLHRHYLNLAGKTSPANQN